MPVRGRSLAEHDPAAQRVARPAPRAALGGATGMLAALQASAGNQAVQRAIAAGSLSL